MSTFAAAIRDVQGLRLDNSKDGVAKLGVDTALRGAIAQEEFGLLDFSARAALTLDTPAATSAPDKITSGGIAVTAGNISDATHAMLDALGVSADQRALVTSRARGIYKPSESLERGPQADAEGQPERDVDQKPKQDGLIKIELPKQEDLPTAQTTDPRQSTRLGEQQPKALAQRRDETEQPLAIDDFAALRNANKQGVALHDGVEHRFAQQISEGTDRPNAQPFAKREPLRLVEAEAKERAPKRDAIALEHDPGAVPSFVEQYLAQARNGVDRERQALAQAA